jgi:excisionase family DNA binding protein
VLPPIAVGIKEAAVMIGVSPNTIRRQVAAGRLHTVRVGRRRVIPIDVLREFVERGKRERT